MSKGNNRGNARTINEKNSAYKNMCRKGRFEDNMQWYISLYRATNGKNNTWKVGSLQADGKIYEAHLTIKEHVGK